MSSTPCEKSLQNWGWWEIFHDIVGAQRCCAHFANRQVMSDTKQLIIPITGMTCANCVATVERSLKKQDGIQTAVVNLSSERATVSYDPSVAGLADMVRRIEHAGYGIATGEADLIIKRLADDNDARRLEKALMKLGGVLEAQVSFTTERARVKYVPTVVSQVEIRAALLASSRKTSFNIDTSIGQVLRIGQCKPC